MKRLTMIALAAASLVPSAAIAHDTETAFASRGACEAASAAMSNDEKRWLLDTFPDVFDTNGAVSSFLTRAWTCDRNPADGKYYITDHRQEILDSAWFLRR